MHEEVVRNLYEAFDRVDLEGVLEHLAPEVRWSTLDLNLEPRSYSGVAEVRDFLAGVFASSRRFSLELDDLLVVGDHVLAHARLRAPQARHGTGYPLAQLWTLQADGLVNRHRLYLSPARAANALCRRLGTARFRVDRSSIRRYAEAVHDANPVYHEVAAAEAAGFADLVAPPMFAAVYSAEAIWTEVLATLAGSGPIDRPEAILHVGQELSWARPVEAGDVVATHAWLDEAVTRGGMELLVFRSLSWSAQGREVAQGTWTVAVGGTGR